jgi:hypothetical protein
MRKIEKKRKEKKRKRKVKGRVGKESSGGQTHLYRVVTPPNINVLYRVSHQYNCAPLICIDQFVSVQYPVQMRLRLIEMIIFLVQMRLRLDTNGPAPTLMLVILLLTAHPASGDDTKQSE